jgi:hypothetical protein
VLFSVTIQGGVWRFVVIAFTTDIENLKLQDSIVYQEQKLDFPEALLSFPLCSLAITNT